jgi:ABC-2 type transport system ATP-binding protein
MNKAFKFKNVVKTFLDFRLGPLDFDLEPGTVLGYIGPNGSGKTTTMQCLVGLLKADSGEMEIFGRVNDPFKPAWKLNIGYVGDKHVFFERWSGAKNLEFMSKFYPNWSVDKALELAKRFRLPLEKRAKDLSSGNRVKLSLISALSHSPRLLILDEPTAGLDPVVRSELLDELFDILHQGERAIFYSTHILSDIKRLVDELAFIDDGKVLYRASKEDLLENWRRISFRLNKKNINFKSTVKIKIEGNDHQLISSNRQGTLQQLKSVGADKIRENRMGIDEIAVHIMKGGKEGVENY